jgi:hypothetical protein
MKAPVRHRILVVFALVLIGSAAPGRAQQPLSLQIAGGRVTLHAQNVPVRTILAEWARLGGATVINGDRVAGAPLTLDLEGVPERQALDIILRGVSGYMLAARDPGGAGASMFDRIMILPTSAAPRNPPPSPAPIVNGVFSNAPTGIVRPVLPRAPDDQQTDDTGVPGNEDGVPLPRPVAIQPRPTPAPGMPVFPPAPIGTPGDTPEQTPPGVVVTPTNPFGLPPGSSSRPGVITPAPPAPVPPPVRNGPQN